MMNVEVEGGFDNMETPVSSQPSSGCHLLFEVDRTSCKREREEDSSLPSNNKCLKPSVLPVSTTSSFATVYDAILPNVTTHCGSPHPLLMNLLMKFSQAEAVLFVNGTSEDLITATTTNSNKKKVRFSTSDFSVLEAPTLKNLASIEPFETLDHALSQIDDASIQIKQQLVLENSEVISVSVDERGILLKQLLFFQQELSSSKNDKTKEYLSKEINYLTSVPHSGLVSNVRLRRAELLSSLIRFEFKRLMSDSGLVMKKRTGNLLQNFEDPGALFHHALKMYGLGRDMIHEFSDSNVIKTFIMNKDNKRKESQSSSSSLSPPVVSSSIEDENHETQSESGQQSKEEEAMSLIQTGCGVCSIFSPLIESLKTVKGSWAFMKPVAELWPELDLDEYAKHVSKPMDLGTLLSNLKSEMYDSVDSVLDDFRSVFYNAKAYNGEGSDIATIGKNIERCFDVKLVTQMLEGEGESLLEAYESHLSDLVTSCSAVDFCLSILDLSVGNEHWNRITKLCAMIDSLEVIDVAYFGVLRDIDEFRIQLKDDLSISSSISAKLNNHVTALNRIRANQKKASMNESITLFPKLEKTINKGGSNSSKTTEPPSVPKDSASLASTTTRTVELSQ